MQGFVGLIAENAAAFQSQTLLTPAGLSMVPNPTFKARFGRHLREW
jgi:hypothetical protein